MPLDLKELMRLHDTSYSSGQVNREQSADDMIFHWVTHWDDQTLEESTLGYRGEFDLLRKAYRQIIAELAENPVQVDFDPVGDTKEDVADFLDGIYRTEDGENSTIEAYSQAESEAVVCGCGAWELYTEYEEMGGNNRNQVIKRRPLYEANNNVYWDPNSKRLDREDAGWVDALVPYSEDGYRKLVKEMTGEELDVGMPSFKYPEQSHTFPWIGGEGKKVYVVRFYHREKVKSKILTFTDPFGETLQYKESEVKGYEDYIIDMGLKQDEEATKAVEEYEVRLYIASGAEILNGEMNEETGEREGEIIVGQNLAIVPMYGERAFIEGEETYEGFVKLAKDPQRLRDFALSYEADVLSRSPRPKPIYWQEQIAGHEDMYGETGSENNYPYLIMNRVAEDGTPLPVQAIGVSPEQTIPQSVFEMIDQTRQAVEDVANPGIPQDVADPDMSGKAIHAIQARIDKQSIIYQIHRKHAKRRDSKIYAGMAAEIFDVPRKMTVTKKDGSRSEDEIMKSTIGEDGNVVVLNDFRDASFKTYSKIGPSYSSQKEQTVERITMMIPNMDPGDPIRRALLLKSLELMDGVEFDDIKEYAKKELILSGITEPETDEEKAMLEQAQNQPQKPDANMQLALAEMEKAKVGHEKNQIEVMKIQANTQNENVKRMIDKFGAITDRLETQISAQEAGANIDFKRAERMDKQVETAIEDMSDDDLMQIAMGQ